MHLAKGWWVPDYDTGDIEANISTRLMFAGRPTYQFDAFIACMPLLRQFRYALDIGAHIGLWSWMLSRRFEQVLAFEPMSEHAACFHENLDAIDNVELNETALGSEAGKVEMAIRPPVSLKARVRTTEQEHIETAPCVRLDDLKYTVSEPIDFIKIDTEGYEFNVIKGGERTIRQHKPLMLVEQKPQNVARYGFGLAAIDLLKEWGAEMKFELNGDYCLGWR